MNIVQWWTVFRDPQLDSLVDRALRSNKSLQVAEARILQARAQRIVAASTGLPMLNALGSYTRLRISNNALSSFTGGTTAGISPSALGFSGDLFQAGLDASWEIDVFGGVRRAVEAANASLAAAQEDFRDTLVTLLGEVATNYFQVRGNQRRIVVAVENIDIQRKTVELTQGRFQAGLASRLEVAQAEALLATTESQIPPLETTVKQSIHQLGVLLGSEPEVLLRELSLPVSRARVEGVGTPNAIDRVWEPFPPSNRGQDARDTETPSTRIPPPPPEVPVGLPSDLLRRRPDIRRAERQLAAATAQIGVAVANLFPKLSLTGSYGYESTQTSNLFSSGSRYWNIGPGLSLPLFSGGQIRGNIQVQTALAQQALATYENTVLTALQDVENSMVAYTEAQAARGSLVRAVKGERRGHPDLTGPLRKRSLGFPERAADRRRPLPSPGSTDPKRPTRLDVPRGPLQSLGRWVGGRHPRGAEDGGQMTEDSFKSEVSSVKHVIASGAKQSPTLGSRLLRRCAPRNDILQISNFTLPVFCLLLFILVSCSRAPPGPGKAGQPSAPPVVPVTVSSAVEKTVPVQVQAVGRALPYATVSVKSRVDGLVTSVHFKDGQYVKAGELLFTLDPTPFEAQLKQAQANRAKDQAQLENARKQVERNAAVVAKGYVSKEQYDQAVANAAALAATVKADEAAIETAQLMVQYCSIVAPITGRAGAVQVDVGNLIKANDPTGVLVVINQVQPIYVSFYVPENLLPDIRKYMASGPLPAEATVPGHEKTPVRGQLAFLDNTVNTSSGTIQLRATFANENLWLWPGQFAKVVLTLTSQPNAVVVPSQAIQTGQKGEYVFVVKPDMTVEYRPVTVGQTVGNETVIEQGVRPGENVVTDGQLRLSDGTHVRIAPPGAAAAGGPTAQAEGGQAP